MSIREEIYDSLCPVTDTNASLIFVTEEIYKSGRVEQLEKSEPEDRDEK